MSDGTRTRDRLDHNQELYQLSYAHHEIRTQWTVASPGNAGRPIRQTRRSAPHGRQEPTARDAKLIQYLNEAYGKERELETALQGAHRDDRLAKPYKKRLQEHLKETTAQAKGLERRIKQLGGKAEIAPMPGPDVAAEAAAR